MSDLTDLRDHARLMADPKPLPPTFVSGWCQRLGPRLPLACEKCDDEKCGHRCHDRPEFYGAATQAERRLWIALADEIDAYLAPDVEQDGLFGEAL